MIWEKDNFKISPDKKQVNIDTLQDMLSRSYWAKDRSRENVEKSIENSLCFSLLKDEEQIGFAHYLGGLIPRNSKIYGSRIASLVSACSEPDWTNLADFVHCFRTGLNVHNKDWKSVA